MRVTISDYFANSGVLTYTYVQYVCLVWLERFLRLHALCNFCFFCLTWFWIICHWILICNYIVSYCQYIFSIQILVRNPKGGFCVLKKDWQHHQVPCWIPDAKLTFVAERAFSLHCDPDSENLLEKYISLSGCCKGLSIIDVNSEEDEAFATYAHCV